MSSDTALILNDIETPKFEDQGEGTVLEATSEAVLDAEPMLSDPDAPESTEIEASNEDRALTTHLIAKLCHDFISPTGAIVSGLDLLDDPQAQDMRDDAIALIRASSKKMVTLVHFARIAFGAATTAEAFSGKDVRLILEDVFSSMRGSLTYGIADSLILTKPHARALINLGYIIGQALPTGGDAKLDLTQDAQSLTITARAEGPRARLKPEAQAGLKGDDYGDGLSGQWIQPYWLFTVVNDAKGTLETTCETDRVEIRIELPLS